jgi:hypothetical protein
MTRINDISRREERTEYRTEIYEYKYMYLYVSHIERRMNLHLSTSLRFKDCMQ